MVIAGPGSTKGRVADILQLPGVSFFPDSHDITSLAGKISRAISSLPSDARYVGWLSDDDLLLPQSLRTLAAELQKQPGASFAFGDCQYIDVSGIPLFINSSGRFAITLCGIGPQLIPQPSVLMRRSFFEKVGGLDEFFSLAFDYDLYIKLCKLGSPIYKKTLISQFRWHSNSLSVSKRWLSAIEASQARQRNRNGLIRALFLPLEGVVIGATYVSGKVLTWKASMKLASTNR